jgi:hypothetical protein
MAGNKGWTTETALDLSDVSDQPPGPVDVGVYCCTITKAEAEATSKGDPAIKMDLHIERAYSGDPAAVDGRVRNLRFETISFKKDALFRLKQLCLALGVEPPRSTGYQVLCDWAADLVGKEVWVKTRLKARYDAAAKKADPDKKDAAVDRYMTEATAADVAVGKADGAESASGEAEAPRAARGRSRAAAQA